MPNVSVFDMNGKKVSDLALAESVFGIEPNSYAMHLCVVNYLANQRQGTQSTRTRSEVSGGGRVQAVHVRVQQELLSGHTAVSHTAPSRESTASQSTRR